MEKLSLIDVQNISLDILKSIHSFCVEKGIGYSVIGGTLLGTVRHQGFIPWDDDIDIMMPRVNYERFCREYTSNKYKLVFSGNDSSCLIAYARVCDISDTIVSGQSWTEQNIGVWIDIFPFDGADDNHDVFCKFYHKISKIWRSTYRERAFYLGESPSNTRKLNIAIKIVNCFHAKWLIKMIGRMKVRRINKLSKRIGYGKTKRVSQYAFCHPGTKEYYTYSAFEHIIEMTFEDMSVCAISGYHEYLSTFYGNYMELPPVEQRCPKQDYLQFYWRENV